MQFIEGWCLRCGANVRWEDEPYVRVYKRETAEWVALGWEARAVFHELIKRVDMAGLLPLGRSGVRGLAGLLRMPLDVVERGLGGPDGLLIDGCVVEVGDGLLMPNYIEAQTAKHSDKLRKLEQRERARAQSMSGGVTDRDEVSTPRDQESRSVTECHARSPGVTRGHAESPGVTLISSDLILAELSRDGEGMTPSASPPATPPDPKAGPKPKRAATKSRCPESTAADVDAWLATAGLPSLDEPEGAEVAKFLDHHSSKGNVHASWVAAWRTWVSRWDRFQPHDVGPAPGRKPITVVFVEPDPPPMPSFIRDHGAAQADQSVPANTQQALLAILGSK